MKSFRNASQLVFTYGHPVPLTPVQHGPFAEECNRGLVDKTMRREVHVRAFPVIPQRAILRQSLNKHGMTDIFR